MQRKPMSRREGRDSARRSSRFDREPSPKRFRRDGLQERERSRVTSGADVDNVDHHGKDHKRRRLHDVVPHEASLAHDSKKESEAEKKDSDKKPNEHNEGSKRLSDPTDLPRSRSYVQHDERGSARQVGRRATGEHGWWKDSRDHHNERAEKAHGRSRDQRHEKLGAKPDDNTLHRKDGPSERKDDPLPTTKKRPAFREKKVPADLGDANPAATEAVKSSQTCYSPERNERRDDRSSNLRHFDRTEKQYTIESASNKVEARRDDFSLRGRYRGGSGNYRGRDRFSVGQGYHPSKPRIEKWKHDLYQEIDKDPIPKNEDDQIAKLEALLAS
ncbi:nuclear speckle splicing regulatory protein 1 isoform X1 [Neltuma alba]|uniref:nuclear speckle splicing regulatory protein 1 isoform X1 n=1 Tax=Neltuma alba TaxID=207710 RepID=UPI0010A3B9D2|nr:nuclear speckle splicing regulatory protein 1 isoform X1 [Prosopis alba]